MYKTSAIILGLLLSTTQAKAPQSVSLFATGTKDDDLVEKIATNGEQMTYIDNFVQLSGDDVKPAAPAPVEQGEPEKVHVLQTPIAKTHTTFYGEDKKDTKPHSLSQIHGDDEEKEKPAYEAGGAEGVHTLDPGAHRTASNANDAYPNPMRTAFYSQKKHGHKKHHHKHHKNHKHSKQVIAPALHQKGSKKKVQPVSPENCDDWVYEYSNENMAGISHAAQKKAKHSKGHRHHKHHKSSVGFLQYNQEAGLWMTNNVLLMGDDAEPKAEGGDEAKAEAKPIGPVEKVQELRPLEYQEADNTARPNYRTSFYAQH